MKKRSVVALVLVTMLCFAGCAAKHQTPQYNSAVAINDFATALGGIQDLEITLAQTGVIAPDLHKKIQGIIEQAAADGKLANSAIKSGDLTSAKSYFTAAATVLEGLQPEMVGIKNPTSQQAFKTALTVAISIAQTWATNLGA